jgi:hypothetical protein
MIKTTIAATAPEPFALSVTYTVSLAKLCRCSNRHARRRCDRNAIPGTVRLGRLECFPKGTVDAGLASAWKPNRGRGEP